jgi:hypothetical protein
MYQEPKNLFNFFVIFVRKEDGLPISIISLLEAQFVPQDDALECRQKRIFHEAQQQASARRMRTTNI